jgi:hypothetical protein
MKSATLTNNVKKEINFHNSTDLPVMIDSWIDGSNKLYSRKIDPAEKCIIHSSTGEWHIHCMMDEESDRQIWVEKGLDKYLLIGKFWSQPCANGNYSWIEWEERFDCVYSDYDLGGETKGLITFVLKKDVVSSSSLDETLDE